MPVPTFDLDIEYVFMLYLLIGFLGVLHFLPDFDEEGEADDEEEKRGPFG